LAGVPWIARHARQRTVGHRLPAEFRHRGLADQDRALFAQPGNCWRVVCRRLAGSQPRSEPGRHAGNQKIVLDTDRNAIEQTFGRARHPTRLRRYRALPRALDIQIAVGVDGAVVPVDPFEHSSKRFDRREACAPVVREQLGD